MRTIYLDNASTTRVDDEAARVALDMMTQEYANPSSLHRMGIDSQLRFEKAKRQILTALKAREGDVYFTSGGTESNNLALFGAARSMRRRGNHIVTTSIEHSSVGAVFRQLENEGFDATYIAPASDGHVDIQKLAKACNENTILVSAMLVNSETGATLDANGAFELIRQRCGAILHTDAVQAFGKIDFSARHLGADLISVSGHKIHAPKGIGALYCSSGCKIAPLFFGGSQQGGIRPGTENTPLAAAFGFAAEKMSRSLKDNHLKAQVLRDELIHQLGLIEGIVLNSPLEGASPYIINFSVPGFRSEVLMRFLEGRGIYVSAGSACAKGMKSHVLTAMGCRQDVIDSAIRISLSNDNTLDDIHDLCRALSLAVKSLCGR